MFERNFLWFFLLLFSVSTNAAGIKELLEAIQNLTSELDEVDNLGDNFYKLAIKNEQYLVQFSTLPSQISDLNKNINDAVPTVERCFYGLGICIVSAAVILTAPHVIRFFVRRYHRKHDRLLEEVKINE